MTDWVQMRVIHTKNPPLIGMWVFWDDHRSLPAVDAALHQLSMKRWLEIAEDSKEP